MTDNKIRCALVYRLDANVGSSGGDEESGGIAMSDLGGTGVTLLAKYDHASEYETHRDSETLYGGRDKSYADAVGMVVGNDPPGAASEPGTLGGFRVVQSEVHQVVYGSDSDGLCLAVVTGLQYPTRTAIQMLCELHGAFSEQFGLQSKSATTDSLTRKSKSLLKSTCAKYDDLSSVDKASSLVDKVDAVKVQMQDNISAMLENTEKAESLAERSDQLNEQAAVFKKKSGVLRKEMWRKDLKMKIILVLLVGGILAAILVPLIMRMQGK
eukprot:CAMPEP_0183305920 /NCGR_PEP_ID=MMETSP0160_2-20130417/10496_1 /TAXON_ID=2839 ORGANISM="Odontella Sinensis, Strain Grunow 1884" /NCGR_SAMPLE_ID=MMETSP0160_2 /ASSEMBLY_ACC=CAM_ASM_000250 /LENGTH=268 /DNA_ID=CAMNT_0025469197 /DNA_START=166 /DNA_END=972 /DNA_ORIENTATION=+